MLVCLWYVAEEPAAPGRTRTRGITSATTATRHNSLPTPGAQLEQRDGGGVGGCCEECSCAVGAPTTQVRLLSMRLSPVADMLIGRE